jgi:hypothetical protein
MAVSRCVNYDDLDVHFHEDIELKFSSEELNAPMSTRDATPAPPNVGSHVHRQIVFPMSYFASRLAGRGDWFWRAKLPDSIDQLEGLDLNAEIANRLRALVASGFDERIVVRALLETVQTEVFLIGAPRHLQRALRNLFKSPEEHAEVRSVVKAIVRAAANGPEITAKA